MKICVLAPVYGIAGVPLAQIRFARALAKRGHEVDLVIGTIDSSLDFPAIPEVRVVKLNTPNVRSMFLPLCRYLTSDRPEVVFSAEDHMNGLLLLAAIATRSDAKISGSSRVGPADTYSTEPFSRGWFNMQLLRSVMWRADALTCVSYDMVDQYVSMFGKAPHVGVYNIIDDEASRKRMEEPVSHPWFADRDIPIVIAAGTLTTRKGFIDLVKGFGIVAAKRNARLVILGEGPLRGELQQEADRLGISDRFAMPGLVKNPLKYFARSTVFALSSYAEGLPNVLVEGMMCGCTPVATDCPTGPREALQDGKYGYLVPMHDPAGMAEGLLKALDHPISPALLEEAVRPFEEGTVIARHFEVMGIKEVRG